ncbi:MAG TPA: 3-hydroxyacyl-CoA dehydrogenase NAD-binding domain-containing protein [Rhodanobacteraceae bacterium]|nr:3-hydroxyacyl-CoA dehydrogenase NAD-binding domain-containing protein [Rhodanobacteraceae bacterium]
MFEGLRFAHWKPSLREDGVVVLTMDRAGSAVNALSRDLLDELDAIVERITIARPTGVVIHSAKPAGFAVGADLHEFAQYEREGTVLDAIQRGQRVFQRLTELSVPTVAAIHGACLGGGAELTLACKTRVAADDPGTRIGLPEVQLGLHPGWGGTARLPRLIGAPKALAMMLTGKPASARAALADGLVDRLVEPAALLDAAIACVRKPPAHRFDQRALAWLTNLWPVRQILAPLVRRQTVAKANPKHYPAPFALIEVWRRGGSDIAQRLRLEAYSMAKLAATPTAHNLIRIFFLRERLRGLAGDVAHGIRHVHVTGAGVMGGDIAAWCALRGFEVSLQDRAMEFVQPTLDRARKLFEKKLKTPQRIAEATLRLHADIEGTQIKDSQLAIEAIFEDAQAKEALYAQIEAKLADDALLASNTSSIPLDELRRALKCPQRFLGLHFFNPVAQMPLVEVVQHAALDPQSGKRALAFVKAIGKLPVPVKGTPGFLVNRILMPYLLEAMRMHSEGVPGSVLDKLAKQFGMPMGPIELADTIGLDVALSVGKELAPFLGLTLPEGIEGKVSSSKRGKKDGEGFYVWRDGSPQKPEVPRDYRAPEDTQDRMILPMLNESVACLAEGVVADADLLDAGVIFGTGFAPFRGGPIEYIRSEGAEKLRARLEALATRYGDRFKPKEGWESPVLRLAPSR